LAFCNSTNQTRVLHKMLLNDWRVPRKLHS
jgi:hypothetical protein